VLSGYGQKESKKRQVSPSGHDRKESKRRQASPSGSGRKLSKKRQTSPGTEMRILGIFNKRFDSISTEATDQNKIVYTRYIEKM
jgi:hypothetical protein